jgi:glutamate---methylamine ligase
VFRSALTPEYHFLGGILAHAEPLATLFTPTVNSFKRINAAPTVSGATWSPNAISYGGNNRTHMVRIPELGRFELRLMDGAANPYLLQAGLLAGGLDGIAQKRDPGRRLDCQHVRAGFGTRWCPSAAAKPARRATRLCGFGGAARSAR